MLQQCSGTSLQAHTQNSIRSFNGSSNIKVLHVLWVSTYPRKRAWRVQCLWLPPQLHITHCCGSGGLQKAGTDASSQDNQTGCGGSTATVGQIAIFLPSSPRQHASPRDKPTVPFRMTRIKSFCRIYRVLITGLLSQISHWNQQLRQGSTLDQGQWALIILLLYKFVILCQSWSRQRILFAPWRKQPWRPVRELLIWWVPLCYSFQYLLLRSLDV